MEGRAECSPTSGFPGKRDRRSFERIQNLRSSASKTNLLFNCPNPRPLSLCPGTSPACCSYRCEGSIPLSSLRGEKSSGSAVLTADMVELQGHLTHDQQTVQHVEDDDQEQHLLAVNHFLALTLESGTESVSQCHRLRASYLAISKYMRQSDERKN